VIQDKLQRPLRYLRISVTDRCNFRCGYCMPKDIFGKGYQFLKSSEILSYEEIEKLVLVFTSLGVTKVRFTGGEPLLRQDLEQLIERLSYISEIQDIAITTNASLLSATRAQSLKQAGIKIINISMDAITPEIYQKMNPIPCPIKNILDGIENALVVGFETVKVNMVVQKGINEHDIIPMVDHFRDKGVILRFIEFMDVGNYNRWELDQVFSSREIIDLIKSRYPLRAIKENYPGEVAKRWQYIDGRGEIGVISSITQPFCNGCTRTRLSAIGELFTCLFARSGFDLRALLRQGLSEREILERISTIWLEREDQYSVQRLEGSHSTTPHLGLRAGLQKVEMSYIGG